MEAKFTVIEKVVVRSRGGSLYIKLPPKVAKLLNVDANDDLAFVKDKTTERVSLLNAKDIEIRLPTGEGGSLAFGLRKELTKRLHKRK